MKQILRGAVLLRMYSVAVMLISGGILVFLVWSDARSARPGHPPSGNGGTIEVLAVAFLIAALVSRVCTRIIRYTYTYLDDITTTEGINRLPGPHWNRSAVTQVTNAYRGTRR